MSRVPVISVVGGAVADRAVCDLAARVGAAVCRGNCHLACGGRAGVMEAACRGFREARDAGGGTGVTVGVLPGGDPAEASPYVDVVLPTGLGLARNAVVVAVADGVVAVGGAAGTLSEIAFALQLGKPLALVSGSGGWSDRLAGAPIDASRFAGVPASLPPEEAVLHVLAALGRGT